MKIKLKNGKEFMDMVHLDENRKLHYCGACKYYNLTCAQYPCSDCMDENDDTDFWEESEIESEG